MYDEKILLAARQLTSCFKSGNKLLLCGNGGSCADSDHIVGELVKAFVKKRKLDDSVKKELNNFGHSGQILAEKLQSGLPAISLCAHNSLVTAIGNDIGYDYIYAQQVIGYGKKGDVLLAISTSGNSDNIINACIAAKAVGMYVMSMTGRSGGKLKELSDLLINVDEDETWKIQDVHSNIYHSLCIKIEEYFWDN